MQFGGAAGTLASLGDQGLAVQAELAKELGLAVPDIPWHVARDGIVEAVSFLRVWSPARCRSLPPTSSC